MKGKERAKIKKNEMTKIKEKRRVRYSREKGMASVKPKGNDKGEVEREI